MSPSIADATDRMFCVPGLLARRRPIAGIQYAGRRGDIYRLWMTLDPHAIAGAFVDFTRGSASDLRELIADDCVDHVSGRTGKDIWDTVSDWLRESFADIDVELHAVGVTDGERVMIWMTTHATHIGSAFPWMRGRPASGRRVAWSQLHVFREEKGRLIEHWAVRDDLRVLEAIDDT